MLKIRLILFLLCLLLLCSCSGEKKIYFDLIDLPYEEFYIDGTMAAYAISDKGYHILNPQNPAIIHRTFDFLAYLGNGDYVTDDNGSVEVYDAQGNWKTELEYFPCGSFVNNKLLCASYNVNTGEVLYGLYNEFYEVILLPDFENILLGTDNILYIWFNDYWVTFDLSLLQYSVVDCLEVYETRTHKQFVLKTENGYVLTGKNLSLPTGNRYTEISDCSEFGYFLASRQDEQEIIQVDSDKKLTLPSTYNVLGADPGNDVVLVHHEGLFEYLNWEGESVLRLENLRAAFLFRNGFARIKTEKGYNYIDEKGTFLLDAWMADAGDFYDGFAPYIESTSGTLHFLHTSSARLNTGIPLDNVSNVQYIGEGRFLVRTEYGILRLCSLYT